MLLKIEESAQYIKEIIQETPDFVIVLGSGLSDFVHVINQTHTIAYTDIPHFPQTSVAGHQGNLIYGTLGNKKVLIMQGRFHYYEGHNMQQVTFPIRVFKALGINRLVLSNASGGVNAKFSVGDIMILTDHINMIPEHPLRGPNLDMLGPRFVDMHEPYNRQWIKLAEKIGRDHHLILHKGTYIALSGPTFETPAEYGMIKALGGDAVGMSTVPEVIVAKHMGMDCFALSVITDLGGPEIAIEVSHDEVLAAANKAMPTVILVVKELIDQITI